MDPKKVLADPLLGPGEGSERSVERAAAAVALELQETGAASEGDYSSAPGLAREDVVLGSREGGGHASPPRMRPQRAFPASHCPSALAVT